MRFDTSEIAHAVEHIRACTEPIDEIFVPRKLRIVRLRTAVGTTPPVLRQPELSDGVPIATDARDDAWLDLIELQQSLVSL